MLSELRGELELRLVGGGRGRGARLTCIRQGRSVWRTMGAAIFLGFLSFTQNGCEDTSWAGRESAIASSSFILFLSARAFVTPMAAMCGNEAEE